MLRNENYNPNYTEKGYFRQKLIWIVIVNRNVLRNDVTLLIDKTNDDLQEATTSLKLQINVVDVLRRVKNKF